MRTRLKDVADKLQLSPGLVSRVLNGRNDVWASEETRARIFAAARELNYQPSTAARALSAGKTNTVSLVYRRLPDLQYRLAYTGLVDVLSEELQNRGYNLVVANFGTEEEVLDHLRATAASRSCEAVIIWGREADTDAQGALLESLGVPFVVKGRHEAEHPGWYQLDYDHEWMMRNALESVVKLGHRRIAYLGFPHDDSFVHALRRGFESSYQEFLGTDPDPRLFVSCEDEVLPNEEAIQRMLDLPERERPTGFVIGAGNYAWQALETCLARRGEYLGFEGAKTAAAGIASYFFSLTFGHALAYQGIEIDMLAKICCPTLLDAILGGSECRHVLRYRPQMTPAISLDLLNQGLQLESKSK